ncbi:MAG TPA: hypothetical protein VNH13_05595 [Candidatus Acidoferrales bacterium]|nr:hypothetical protein [Candidatus Acidoferrales bacterium]
MNFDLTFRNVSFAQGKKLLEAAIAAGVDVDAVEAPRPAVAPSMGFPAVAQEKVFPGTPADVAAPAPAAAAKREPGSDDGPPLTEADAAFFRCPTVKSVVKMLVGDQASPDADKVLADVRALRARGVAALEAVPEEQLADRVSSSLAALGF